MTKVTTEGASHEHKLSKIVIIAKQSKFEVLKEALASIGVSGMTVTKRSRLRRAEGRSRVLPRR